VANRSFTRGSRSRRRTHWIGVNGALSTAASTSVLLFTSQVGHEGETIVRVRGLLTVGLETAASAFDGYFGAFGMAIVTSAAAAAGVGSLPTPITEEGWDGWLLHRYFAIERTLGAGSPGEYDRLQLDSKAMRKANEDEALVGVVELLKNGTSIANVQVRARVLSMIG